MLAVERTNISVPLAQCLLGQGATSSFTVQNAGGGTLNWAATTGDGYAISPASGTLRASEQAGVTVSGISKNGRIAVTAPGVAGSPQTVTITCAL
jgi:hypothetical protein